MRRLAVKEVIAVRFEEGEELSESLSKFLEENDIRAGVISGIGGFSSGAVGIFDPDKGGYREVEFNEFMEVASLSGNVSLKDGKPFYHIHVVLGNEKRVLAGHFLRGRVKGTMEVFILVLEGEIYRRIKQGHLVLLDL